MKKTKSENPKIEIRIVPGSIKHWGTIKYRIAKDEIPWWKRNFLFNPWKVLYGRDFYGSFSTNYYLPDCERLLNRLKTLRDVEEYIREEKEKEIHRLMDEERARYEETEAYKEHNAKLDELFERLKVEGQKRRKEAEKHKPKRRAKAKHISEEEMAKFREQNRLEKEARIDALPEPLRSIIRGYEALPDEAKKVFRKETWVYEPGYDDYKDPITKEKDMKELLEILVQTTIDFINERKLTDIWSVGFGADDLQSSAKAGEWICSTDASIHVTGMGKEKAKDGHEYTVCQNIGSYM